MCFSRQLANFHFCHLYILFIFRLPDWQLTSHHICTPPIQPLFALIVCIQYTVLVKIIKKTTYCLFLSICCCLPALYLLVLSLVLWNGGLAKICLACEFKALLDRTEEVRTAVQYSRCSTRKDESTWCTVGILHY